MSDYPVYSELDYPLTWTESGKALNTWTGGTSSNWNTANNWSLIAVPTSADDVTIPSGTPHQPTIQAGTSAYCKTLTIQSGAVLNQAGTSASYFYVYGDFNSDAGQFIMSGTQSFLYFTGSINNWWDDDNENDTYTNIRVEKSTTTAQTTLWHNMTCSGTFEVREGIFAIDQTWTLTVTNTGTSAFEVEDGGRLILTDETITCAGDVNFENGSQATISGGTINCARNFVVDANASYNIAFTGGTLRMNGSSTQYINDLDGGTLDLYDLVIAKSAGTCYLASTNLDVNRHLTISGGILSCYNAPSPTATYNINVGGDWTNTVGTTGFVESTGRVTFDGGYYHQYCSNETFNILEVNKSAGGSFRVNTGTVICAQYDWTAGDVDVNSGTFTALDLADSGLDGGYWVNPGGTINLHQDLGQYVDLRCHLNFNGGGTINVYGGNGYSYWPYTNNASITMSGGVLDFKDNGILISSSGLSLTDNITGGTIRMSQGFVGNRADFTPTAGVFEFYGSSDYIISQTNGCTLCDVVINKSAKGGEDKGTQGALTDERSGIILSDGGKSNTITMGSNFAITGDLNINAGTLNANAQTFNLGGNWTNIAGSSGFTETTGKVVFDGANPAFINNSETFYHVDINKTYPNFDGLSVYTGTVTNILGNLNILDGTLEMDNNTTLNLTGNLNIALDAGFNLYGDTDLYFNIGGNWTNNNSGYNTVYGFSPGGTVTFNGSALQTLNTAAAVEEFGNLVINKSDYFRPNDNLRMFGNFDIMNGDLWDQVAGLTHYVFGNMTIGFPALYWSDGTTVFKGTADQYYTGSGGGAWFTNVVVDKTAADDGKLSIPSGGEPGSMPGLGGDPKALTLTLNSGLVCYDGGNLTIDEGTVDLNHHTLKVTGIININAGGIIQVDDGAELNCETTLNINNLGTLQAYGTAGSNAKVGRDASGNFVFNVNSGGTISSRYTIFEDMNENGINIKNGSFVDASNAFSNCIFRHGISGTSALLVIHNNQDFTVNNAVFPTNTWGGSNNVWKNVNTGHVLFDNATGGFAGPAYEYDPFTRIDWTGFVPGLWTGAVSTNWFTPGNWSDGNVPVAATNVTIPAGCPNYPVISGAAAVCDDMDINTGASLTIGNNTLTAGGDVYINGLLTMTNASAVMNAYQIYWMAGSSDNVTAGTFHVTGLWYFLDGTNAKLGTGNTAYVYNLHWPEDADAEFGNLVRVPGSKQMGSDNKAYYPIRVAGNLTVQTGAYLPNVGVDLIVAGNSVIQNGGSLGFVNGSDYYNTGTMDIAGTINLSSGSVVTCNGELTFPSTGYLNLGSDGQFLCNYNDASSWTYLNGRINMSGTSIFEMSQKSVLISSTFNDNDMTGGTLRFGRSLSATNAGNFQLTGVLTEFISGNSGHYVDVVNGNYLHAMRVNKPSGTIQVVHNLIVKNNMVIDAGAMTVNDIVITAGGDWTNNVGTSGFDEGTGRVIFNGSADQNCSAETFNILEVNKTGGNLVIPATTSCASYDWTAGGVAVTGGTFTANDLADNGIFGNYSMTSGAINLTQDAVQFTDLNGNLTISGGTMTVNGGNGPSYWSFGANCNLTMSNGTLDFVNQGVIVYTSGSTFTENITGGIIRTNYSFEALNDAFTPTGGTVELYGGADLGVHQNPAANFYNLTINKAGSDNENIPIITDKSGNTIKGTKGNSITAYSNLIVSNNLTVEKGTLNLNGYESRVSNNATINSTGILNVNYNADLLMGSGKTITVNNGGLLSVVGVAGYEARVSRISAGNYNLNIESGGSIAANYGIFEYMTAAGVNVKAGAFIDPVNSFHNCTFRNGAAGGTLLTLNNSGTFTANNTVFPANTWSGTYNVSKAVNAGVANIYYSTGDFAGQTFESDPNNRINWDVPVAGLWTGAVSTNWFTAGNWSDGNVPVAVTNVTIPAGCPNYPVISGAAAVCGDMDINTGASLTVGNNTLTAGGTVDINGLLTMTNAAAVMNAYRINWNSGSSDNVTAGTFEVTSWAFYDGTTAKLGTGNTAYCNGIYFPTDADAEFGNLVAVPGSKLMGSDNKAYYPIRVAGNLTVQTGAFWVNMGIDLIVAGNSVFQDGSIFHFHSGADYYNTGTLNLAGVINLEPGSVITCNGELTFPATGHLNMNQAGFICDHNVATGWIDLNGKITMNAGSVLEFSGRSISIGSTFVNEITGGTLRFGRSLNATYAGTFQIGNALTEFISGNTGHYVQLTNGNFLKDMRLNKTGGNLQVYDNLQLNGNMVIDAGVLDCGNKTISLFGNWTNNVGVAAFTEGTGRVIFASTADQTCSTENFNILEVNKPAGTYVVIAGTTTCAVYDWNGLSADGGISVTGGTFTAFDLEDPGIYGTFEMTSGAINLAQDAAQYPDLNATLNITGGSFTMTGGSGLSHWSYGGNASITLSGSGVIDFANNGIYVHQSGTYTLTESITGGTIRTNSSFFAENSNFTPAGGVVELYGGTDVPLYTMNSSSLYNLLINKSGSDGSFVPVKDKEGNIIFTPKANGVGLADNLTVTNLLTVDEGTLTLNGFDATIGGDIAINSGGILSVPSNSDLRIASEKTLAVNNGGTLSVLGSAGNTARVSRISAGYYNFNVESGGTIGANYGIFEYMLTVHIKSGAIVDAVNSFHNCTFQNGQSGGRLLSIINNQTFTVNNAVFPANTWSGTYNAYKNVNSGVVNFVGATGGFAGAAFEYDPNNRINWTTLTNNLNVKVWLEGPFNGTDMNTGLPGLSTFPLSQPYHVSPWNYGGTESVVTVPTNVVDWVLIELRDAPTAALATPATQIKRMAGFLKKDGSVVSTDGTSVFQFTETVVNGLFVVIWHRNHLEIISATPLVKTGDTYNFDFRPNVSQAYNGSSGYKAWGAGVAVMVASDGNHDGEITPTDKTFSWNQDAGKKGYFSGDFDMNTQVNNLDKDDMWYLNYSAGFSSQVPD